MHLLRRLSEEIKQRLDYRSFYSRYCANARVSAIKLRARCPLPAHEHSGKGTPSLSVDLQRGLFYCFSCGESGDAIRFYELMNGLTFSRSVFELAKELNLNDEKLKKPSSNLRIVKEQIIEEPEPPLERERIIVVCKSFLDAARAEDQTEGVNYLERRKISQHAINSAGVVYFPRKSYHRVMRRLMDRFDVEELQKSGLFNEQGNLTFYRHRLIFPFYAERQVIYFQARTIASGIEPRWHNLRGGVPLLYNSDSLAKLTSGSIIYLVEGFTDTLTLLTHGFNVVGIVGAGGFKEEWLSLIGRFRVVAALDGDKAGQTATERYEEMFAARGIKLNRLHLPSDVNDFFRSDPSAPIKIQLLTETLFEE